MNLKSEILKKCPLFIDCADSEIEEILKSSTSISVRAGDPVFVLNDTSKFVYVVLSGAIDIVGQENFKNQYFKIRTVKPKEHFGELSILAADRHRSSAFAAENSELLCIDGEYYLELFRRVDKVNRNQIDRLIEYYLHNMRWQTSLPVLEDVSEHRFNKAFLKLPPIKLPMGRKAVPIRVESNIVTVAVSAPLSTELINSIRTQYPSYKIKLQLMEDTVLDQYRKLYLNFHSGQSLSSVLPTAAELPLQAPNADFEDLKQSTLLLSQLPADIFKKLAGYFTVNDYSEGDVIFSPTRPSDRLYFVGSGEVELDKGIQSLNVQIPFATAEQYDIFFDTSLFTSADNMVTAIARSRCRIFSIGQDIFQQILKRSDFAVPFAITMAQLISRLNKNKLKLEFYQGDSPLLNPQTQHLIPRAKIAKVKVLPLDLVGKDLTLGVLETNQEVLDDLIESHLRSFNVRTCLITEENFGLWMADIQANTLTEDTTKVYKNSSSDDRLLKTANANANLALEQILEEAILHRASDIHFEPTEKFLIVRYRIDGVMMQIWNNIPMVTGDSIIRRIKVLCEMDIAEMRLPQDGQFEFKKNEFESSFRASSLPTRFGEKIVLRTTGRKNSVIPLQLLAPDTKITKFFNRLIKYQQGIFFITGPTGSGKSTSLYSILNELNKPDRNIITIEDPIEANITGINQIQINPEIGLTHESILRNVLRQDPDVIMVGEIRDAVTMQLALDAALSGQLVLTTIHAGSTFEVIPRLKELGATTSHIAAGLIGVMSQRLVRRLCDGCKKPKALSAKELEIVQDLNYDEPITHAMTAVGCSRCDYTGYVGQIPVFEFWEKTLQIHHALMDNASSEEIQQAIRAADVETLTKYGLKMVVQGLTTFSEVNDVLFGIAELMAS